MKYQIFFPKKYNEGQPEGWPLLVFLHGANQRGDDLELLKKKGPIKPVVKLKLPFVILAPQCVEEEYWENNKVLNLIDLAIEQHNINPRRVYLTGLSMGGFGTWQIAGYNPEKFAAIAPICGGGTKHSAHSLREMPIWIFHGAKDKIIPISKSEEMVDFLKREGNSPKFTVYQEAGHDSWTETYDNLELYEWFLQHEKK